MIYLLTNAQYPQGIQCTRHQSFFFLLVCILSRTICLSKNESLRKNSSPTLQCNLTKVHCCPNVLQVMISNCLFILSFISSFQLRILMHNPPCIANEGLEQATHLRKQSEFRQKMAIGKTYLFVYLFILHRSPKTSKASCHLSFWYHVPHFGGISPFHNVSILDACGDASFEFHRANAC